MDNDSGPYSHKHIVHYVIVSIRIVITEIHVQVLKALKSGKYLFILFFIHIIVITNFPISNVM